MRMFVHHIKGQCKIYLLFDSDSVFLAGVETHLLQNFFLPGVPFGVFQHFRLKIRCDDPSSGSDQFGHGDGKMSGAAAYVENGLAFTDEGL